MLVLEDHVVTWHQWAIKACTSVVMEISTGLLADSDQLAFLVASFTCHDQHQTTAPCQLLHSVSAP